MKSLEECYGQFRIRQMRARAAISADLSITTDALIIAAAWPAMQASPDEITYVDLGATAPLPRQERIVLPDPTEMPTLRIFAAPITKQFKKWRRRRWRS